jgi:predicted ATPase/transcriptional regulator with XRE-family HTH domain
MATMDEPFGSRVRQRRRALDLTQEALAERAGCSVEMIKKLEAGRARPSRQLAELLAAALDVPAAEQAGFVQAGRTGGLVDRPTAQSTPLRAPGGLPLSLTALIGREHERAAAAALLRAPATRLVTFTGPGGTGKTRLAVQVAADLRETFPDGAWFVALAPITDPALVLPAIATTLGLREASGQAPLAHLYDYLRAKRMLLVLDNFEQVLDAAAGVAALLAPAPGLTVLVTSRVALRVRGGREFPVPPLALPAATAAPTVETLAASAAVRLFVERAHEVRLDFALTAENASAVAAICRRLDGLPLAIELAAAWIKILPPAQLLARLTDRLRLLAGGGPDLPDRQQTIQATIDWSYNLLAPAEQILFRRLAVFTGGWILDAAEAVCDFRLADGATPQSAIRNPNLDVLAGLLRLVNASLVIAEEREGEERYRFLETIRAYAEEKLRKAGEAETAHARHGDWFLRFAEEAAPHLRAAEQLAWLAQLETEHDNLRAALDWCLAAPDGAETGLRLAGALWEFWLIRGHLSEGRRRLAAALARPGAEAPTAVRAQALCGLSRLALFQGDFGSARAPIEESVALWRALGDDLGLARALDGLQELLHAQGEGTQVAHMEEAIRLYERAGEAHGLARATMLVGVLAEERGERATFRRALERNIAFYREIGDRRELAIALMRQAWVAPDEGSYTEGLRLIAEALTYMRALNDKTGIMDATMQMASMARMMGDYARAAEFYEEALALGRDLGSRSWMAGLLLGLGNVARDQHDPARAEQLYTEALALSREVSDKLSTAWNLRSLGALAEGAGANERALELYEQGLALFREIGLATDVAWMQRDLGQVALQRGDLERAAALFAESLRIMQAHNNGLGILRGLLGLGAVAAEREQPLVAARVFGAADVLLARMNMRHDAVDQASYDRALARARQGTDAAAWDAAWVAGATLSPADACAYALTAAGPSASAPLPEEHDES